MIAIIIGRRTESTLSRLAPKPTRKAKAKAAVRNAVSQGRRNVAQCLRSLAQRIE